MTAWEKAISFVLQYEGGYSNDPDDSGGETKYGISKNAYPHLDIESLTLENAKEIYKRDYWAACRCDEMPPSLAICLFDSAVNQGVGTAKRILQKALGVKEDGNFGPVTMDAIKSATPTLLRRFLAMRLVAYHRIMCENPKNEKYAMNWFYRVTKLHDLILTDPFLL